MHLVGQGKKPENILYHHNIRSMGCQLVVVFGPFCSEKIKCMNCSYQHVAQLHQGISQGDDKMIKPRHVLQS